MDQCRGLGWGPTPTLHWMNDSKVIGVGHQSAARNGGLNMKLLRQGLNYWAWHFDWLPRSDLLRFVRSYPDDWWWLIKVVVPGRAHFPPSSLTGFERELCGRGNICESFVCNTVKRRFSYTREKPEYCAGWSVVNSFWFQVPGATACFDVLQVAKGPCSKDESTLAVRRPSKNTSYGRTLWDWARRRRFERLPSGEPAARSLSHSRWVLQVSQPQTSRNR